MLRVFPTLLLSAALLAPLSASAEATLTTSRAVFVSAPTPDNAYTAGATVVVSAPVEGDFSGAGGSVVIANSVSGDALLFGGSLDVRSAVEGDVRSFGGSFISEKDIGGDLAALGASVVSRGSVGGSVFVLAADTRLSGAQDSVVVYGNTVFLEGEYGGDVRVVAASRVTLGDGVRIRGELSYQAPEPALIPESAVIDGGVLYENASFLPDPGTSRTLALISVGIFLLARLLGALILAGLFAGLFPRLALAVSRRAHEASPRRLLLTALLGFAALVATPVLLAFLTITFIGIGIAALLFAAYALLAMLSFLYAGILVGSMLARRFEKRETVLWRDGVLGMLVLSLAALVPVIGWFVVSLLALFSAGCLLLFFFRFAFPHEEDAA